MKHITVGTRASKLAIVQTQLVIERLRQQCPNLEITIEQIHTTGDRVTDRPLSDIGGDGVFVTEIERALQERYIDVAVHSLKDLPTAQPDGLRLVVIGPREDVRDVLVWKSRFDQEDGDETRAALMPPRDYRGRIGTCSLRRMAQIRGLYPGTHILPIRGNVDTRLRKLEAHEYDGIVLAAAGLHRLHGPGLQELLADRVAYLPIEAMMPAPGQGALALEIRDEPEMWELVAPLNDTVTQATTTAERMFMRHLGAGCYLPVAAFGEIQGEELTLRGLVISLDGQRQVRVQQSINWTAETTIEDAEQLGITLAEGALAQGAVEIIGKLNIIRGQERTRA
ncbi:MAG: hydroxymethylbilane synthase [Ktedonobacteraceae bacterium]